MTIHKSLRELAQTERPIVVPNAHDAFSARLIAGAGFKAVGVGGSSMLAARYGLPDLGIAALGEMAAGISDIVSAVPHLPCFVDGDDGYGDVKSVVRVMEIYQRIGVGGVVFEDQARMQKQPGDDRPNEVVPIPEFTQKLRAAIAARHDPSLVIVARTDSLALEGLDGALRRCEAYLQAGADGVFVTGMTSEDTLRTVGAAFRGTYSLTVANESGKSPWLSPAELYALGFAQVTYPAFLMLRQAVALERGLSELKQFADGTMTMSRFAEQERGRAIVDEALHLARWQALQ